MSDTRPGMAVFGQYIAAVGLALVGNLAARMIGGPGWLRAAVALAAVVPLGLLAIWFHRALLAGLDELVQRVVLEGFAFALMGTIVVFALYLNLRAAGVGMFRVDPPDILMLPALLVGVGIGLAWRRYA